MELGLRSIHQIISPRKVSEAGFELDRFFGRPEAPGLDPFLLLDRTYRFSIHKADSGPPAHPSRGMETVSYQIAGKTQYRDHRGNNGIVTSGGCRWVNCAGGVFHQELPLPTSTGYQTVNFWLNLPLEEKYGTPVSRLIMPQEIPVHRGNDGIIIRVIAGEYEQIIGPGGRYPESCLFLDAEIPPATPLELEIPADYRVIALCLDGEGLFDLSAGTTVAASQLINYGPGERVALMTENDEVRVLILAARPMRIPVAWYGPIVMESQEALEKALSEYSGYDFQQLLPD